MIVLICLLLHGLFEGVDLALLALTTFLCEQILGACWEIVGSLSCGFEAFGMQIGIDSFIVRSRK